MGRGCGSQRVCSTPLFSLLPAITALFSSSPLAQPAAHVQAPGIFLFYPATPLPIFFTALKSSSTSSSRPLLCPSSWSFSCKCVYRRRLPRCTPLAAILAQWTQQEKLFSSSEGLLDSPLTIFFLLLPVSLFSLSLSSSSSPLPPLSALGQQALTGW